VRVVRGLAVPGESIDTTTLGIFDDALAAAQMQCHAAALGHRLGLGRADGLSGRGQIWSASGKDRSVVRCGAGVLDACSPHAVLHH